MCFPYIIKRNFVKKYGQELSILYFCLLYLFICLASVIMGFDYFSVVRPLK